ncbi:hypothetical protein AK812_SmicGene26808 [Symbiodinium microadriaticum]|uniref:Uncharacterized protein n=1 Tax=Symbiodinium microadriaticum TaxID=2951 RepID=A0A1Q9D8L9_SYMMI|nr:hypothetical protein AK812_SmicGene26808 [Symbiodinium microadriaticum]
MDVPTHRRGGVIKDSFIPGGFQELFKVQEDVRATNCESEAAIAELERHLQELQQEAAKDVAKVDAEFSDLLQKQALERNALREEAADRERAASNVRDREKAAEDLQELEQELAKLRVEEEELVHAHVTLKAFFWFLWDAATSVLTSLSCLEDLLAQSPVILQRAWAGIAKLPDVLGSRRITADQPAETSFSASELPCTFHGGKLASELYVSRGRRIGTFLFANVFFPPDLTGGHLAGPFPQIGAEAESADDAASQQPAVFSYLVG